MESEASGKLGTEYEIDRKIDCRVIEREVIDIRDSGYAFWTRRSVNFSPKFHLLSDVRAIELMREGGRTGQD